MMCSHRLVADPHRPIAFPDTEPHAFLAYTRIMHADCSGTVADSFFDQANTDRALHLAQLWLLADEVHYW